MEKIECFTCKEKKVRARFSKDRSNKTGLQSSCKECKRISFENYRHTKEGLISIIYGHQRAYSKKRGHLMPGYTKQELTQWLINQPLFDKLYSEWKDSGFDRLLSPSCDRKDNDKGYSLANIKLMTFDENQGNAWKDTRLGKLKNKGLYNGGLKPVIKTDPITKNTKEFRSASGASRITGISRGCITACCNNRMKLSPNGKLYMSKSAGGYTWAFKNKKDVERIKQKTESCSY
jgi:hypothetical protein